MAPLQPPTWPPAWPPAPPLLFKHSKPGGPNSNNHHAFFIFAATVLVLGIIAVIAVAGSGNPATGPRHRARQVSVRLPLTPGLPFW